MLTANQAVARYLERRGIGSLHRVHEKPDPKKILEFEELAHAFGYSLGIENLSERARGRETWQRPRPQRFDRGEATDGRHGRAGVDGGRDRPMTVSVPALDIAIRPEHYQRLAEKIAGKPEERIVSYLMLRSLKQARYAAEPLGHFALAFDQYTHFTSPIRRYPDLIVHRVLKWALDHPESRPAAPAQGSKNEESTFGPYRRGELEAIAEETSETERRAETAERELMAWKTAQFMEQHLGEEYDALIISVQKFGFFVELTEIFVEGIVPIDRIEETYRRAGLLPRARSRHRFRKRRRPARVATSRGGSSKKKSGRGTSQRPDTSGNSATASASAPNASIRFAAASNFHLYPEREPVAPAKGLPPVLRNRHAETSDDAESFRLPIDLVETSCSGDLMKSIGASRPRHTCPNCWSV